MTTKRSVTDAALQPQEPRTRRSPFADESIEGESPTPSSATPSSTDDVEDLSTGITGHETIVAAVAKGGRTVEELEDEVEALESVIERLDQEKHALRTRLNEVDFFKMFDFGDCKKWLTNNYEFDRRDTPELLAGIFENYLLQNDAFEPLPHQLLIKNSVRAQAKREKMVQGRSNLHQKRERERAQAAEAKARKAPAKPPQNPKAAGDVGHYGQYLYINPDAVEELYATKPWGFIIEKWPALRPTTKTPNVDSLATLQSEFVKKNVIAIWERTHWFPIKQEQGRSPAEVTLLARQHNRRKRRQAQLKERLEFMSVDLRAQYEKALLEQSIFGTRWVDTILKRPNLWLPRESESLVDQLEELDALEPERTYRFD